MVFSYFISTIQRRRPVRPSYQTKDRQIYFRGKNTFIENIVRTRDTQQKTPMTKGNGNRKGMTPVDTIFNNTDYGETLPHVQGRIYGGGGRTGPDPPLRGSRC